MSKTVKYLITLFILVDLVLLICFVWQKVAGRKQEEAMQQAESTESGSQDLDPTAQKKEEEQQFTDNKLLFNYDMTKVDCIYVTVTEGSESEGTNHSFDEVNSYINAPGMEKTPQYLANALVQVGDETGPLEGKLGFGKSAPNATINVRGKSSTEAPQKSYKLELFKDAGFWNGQRTIALNKHYYDSIRVRNALFFRMIREVPSMISLRTYFVHLYICDNTSSGDGSGKFVDYGIFTAVEQPNNRFMKNHGLSNNGYLYKAYEFEFYRYEDNIRLITDPLYNEDKFNAVLEPKADTTDHTKLVRMLEEVNDYSLPIEDIVAKYFDLDNILNYMAFNMIMINPDSNAQNYYLYSPVNSEKWYLICWDGDACLKATEKELRQNALEFEGSWTLGISMHSCNILFRRVMCCREYRDMLTQRVEELRAQFPAERIAQLMQPLSKTVEPYLFRSPDLTNLSVTLDQYKVLKSIIPQDIERGYRQYMESLNAPLPFYLGEVLQENGKLQFSWDDAYDFDSELVRYEIQIGTDPAFSKNSILKDETMLALSYETDMLPPGDYYYRVIATNASGYSRLPYDMLERDRFYDGVRAFRVKTDGSVVMPE